MRKILIALLALFELLGCNNHPENQGPSASSGTSHQWVTDNAQVLTAQEILRLSRVLAEYERETTHQIAVLTVASLGGETIEAFSLRTANAWGLGRKGIDNGILIVLAADEGKVRIELGSGFEPYISNARAQEIINAQMLPAFRDRNYSKGLENGIEVLMKDGRAFTAPR